MKKLLFVAAAGVFILATSCKKNDSNQQTDQFSNVKDAEKITQFFEDHARKQESFTIDVATGGTITTSKGTKVKFPANIFKTSAGAAVTGSVTVKVLDVFEAGDMILNHKPTITTSGEQLISFGEIRVDAEQGGNALLLNATDNNRVQVIFPIGGGQRAGQNIKEIPLWNGVEPEVSTYDVSGYNHENQSTTVSQSHYIYPGISWQSLSGYGSATTEETSFFLDNLGTWRNCDILVNDPRTKTTVLCYLGDFFNNETSTNYSGIEPSSVYFKLKNENTLIKLYNVILNPVAGKQGFLSYQNTMPIGGEGSFLAISTLNGKFYAQVKDVTIASPESGKNYFGINFNLTEVTEAELVTLINDMKNK
ncbi:MAG: hypothetical protein IT249_19330 [Chitinophagaceae bacterium]|nr:hypothetical protein [Chitinophagaceae bacterium]